MQVLESTLPVNLPEGTFANVKYPAHHPSEFASPRLCSVSNNNNAASTFCSIGCVPTSAASGARLGGCGGPRCPSCRAVRAGLATRPLASAPWWPGASCATPTYDRLCCVACARVCVMLMLMVDVQGPDTIRSLLCHMQPPCLRLPRGTDDGQGVDSQEELQPRVPFQPAAWHRARAD